ncbi:MAG: YHS domain-containing (seleno)protein [Thermodesulfobacteriota bacterium]
MIRFKSVATFIFVLSAVFSAGYAFAGSEVYSQVGAGGYDLVSYHQADGPKEGTGLFVVEHADVNYLFSSEENKNTFAENPDKYLPAYGGWCAYGAALGKKFIGDPKVSKIVDGKLYLNLNNEIQGKWEAELQKNIAAANEKWNVIKDKSPSEL